MAVMKIAVSAVQGDFQEHEKVFEELGAECVELRKKEDVDGDYDALVLPGGESTVQGKLLRELGMFDGLKKRIEAGIPVFATCAGLILLAEELENDERRYFRTLPVRVRRNAYGRQLGSFFVRGGMKHVGEIPMTFIRAPYIEEAGNNTEVLAETDGWITAVRSGNQLAMSFHPELDPDRKIYKYFLNDFMSSGEARNRS